MEVKGNNGIRKIQVQGGSGNATAMLGATSHECNGVRGIQVQGGSGNSTAILGSTAVLGNYNIIGNNSTNTINVQIPVAVLYEMLAQLKALNAKMEMQLDVITRMQKQLIEKK